MAIFQVNLSGILKVLSDSLYSSQDVFIRELLQNAVDAITAKSYKTTFQPNIKVSYFQNSKGDGLIIQDNGIGLTKDEVEAFLSRIGASSKSLDSIEETRNDFIGQFGIGLLSCFMVSDEIVVLTKSYGSEEGVKWTGKIDGTYATEDADVNFQGTRVVLKLRQSANLSPKKVENLLDLYGSYLNVPIQLDVDGHLNKDFHKAFPWESGEVAEDVSSFGLEQFDIPFPYSFPISDLSGETKGIAYILPRAAHFGEEAGHKIYIRNMFISDQAKDMLPNWAFFVRAVVNSSNLSPTASRESIYKNETLKTVRKELGNSIKNNLRKLANQSPKTLKYIVSVHNTALKSMALTDEDFLKFISDWFSFETSKGTMTLAEIKTDAAQSQQSIFYVSDIDEFKQLTAIAAANDTLVINAGYIYGTPLFKQLAKLDANYVYQNINTEYFSNVLKEVSLEEYDRHRTTLERLQVHLDEFECELDIKQFEPNSIPALFYMSKDQLKDNDIQQIKSMSDDLWASISDSVYTQKTVQYQSKLFLNYKNPIVQKILTKENTKAEKSILQMLLFNAMMMGRYPLFNKEMKAMNTNLLFLLNEIS